MRRAVENVLVLSEQLVFTPEIKICLLCTIKFTKHMLAQIPGIVRHACGFHQCFAMTWLSRNPSSTAAARPSLNGLARTRALATNSDPTNLRLHTRCYRCAANFGVFLVSHLPAYTYAWGGITNYCFTRF